MENNNNGSGKGWALGFGLLAGIAFGYYLNSNEGRALQNKARVRFDEYGNQINEYGQKVQTRASEYADTAKTRSQEYLDQAKVKANELAEKGKSTLEESKTWATTQAESLKSTVNEQTAALKKNTNQIVDSSESSFKRGVNKAKRTIDENRQKVDKATKS